MSFIPPVLRLFNFTHLNVSKDKQGSQNTLLSIILSILKHLGTLFFNQKALEDVPPTRPNTPGPDEIRFNPNVKVVLVPTRQEYYAEMGEGEDCDKSLGDVLWYGKEEIKLFRTTALAEINLYAKKWNITFKEAKNILDQSEFEAITQSTWDNRWVTEKSIEIFKTFKRRTLHLKDLNVQLP